MGGCSIAGLQPNEKLKNTHLIIFFLVILGSLCHANVQYFQWLADHFVLKSLFDAIETLTNLESLFMSGQVKVMKAKFNSSLMFPHA